MILNSTYYIGSNLRNKKVTIFGSNIIAQNYLLQLIHYGASLSIITRYVTPTIEDMVYKNPKIILKINEFKVNDLKNAWCVILATSDSNLNRSIIVESKLRQIICIPININYKKCDFKLTKLEHCTSNINLSIKSINSIVNTKLKTKIDCFDFINFFEIKNSKEVYRGVGLIGGGPGNVGLVTILGLSILTKADIVIIDRLIPKEILNILRSDTEIINAAKIPYGHTTSQEMINRLIINRAKIGKFVIRLKGGDPFIFARGYEEIIACIAAGISVTVIPGVTSAISVPAFAKIPLTYRGMTHQFIVLSGHILPGHPKSLLDWKILATINGTIILLMAIERIEFFIKILLKNGKNSNTPIVIIHQGTTLKQKILKSTLEKISTQICMKVMDPPVTVVIGQVASFLI